MMVTIEDIIKTLVFEDRRNGNQWYIRKECNKSETAGFIKDFIKSHIINNYTDLLDLDLQYRIFADVAIVISDYDPEDDIEDSLYEYDFGMCISDECIDLLHDVTFRSLVEDNIGKHRMGSGIIPTIQYTYDSICIELCQKLISTINE